MVATTGLVLKKYSGFYYVDSNQSILECKLRGKVKTPVLTGDKVNLTVLDTEQGIIEEILPRENELIRPRIANVSKVLIVMCYDRPAPSLGLMDRLLFLALYNNIQPAIIINKCDLKPDPKTIMARDYYPQAGFELIETSAKEGVGIDKLRDIVKDQINVFAGPSGVGKSSLLNVLINDLHLKTGEVSNKIGCGKHTTRHVELYPLPAGGWIADTPGFGVLDLPRMERYDLAKYYPDFMIPGRQCRFNNCLHWKENDCGVKEAVQKGLIADFRYQNYLVMLEEIIKNERCY